MWAVRVRACALHPAVRTRVGTRTRARWIRTATCASRVPAGAGVGLRPRHTCQVTIPTGFHPTNIATTITTPNLHSNLFKFIEPTFSSSSSSSSSSFARSRSFSSHPSHSHPLTPSDSRPNPSKLEHPHAPTSAAESNHVPASQHSAQAQAQAQAQSQSHVITDTAQGTTAATATPASRIRFPWSRSSSSSLSPPSASASLSAPPVSVKRLLSLTRPEWPILGCGMLSLSVAASITMYVPTAFGKLIDIVTHAKDIAGLNSFATMLCGLFVVGAISNFGRVAAFQLAGHRVIARLRRVLFSSIMSQDIAFFDKNRTGELINRLSADTVVISKSLTGDNLSSGLRNIAQGIFGMAYMIHLSPQLTLCMIGIIPVVFIGGVYGRWVKSLSKQVQDALGKTTDVAEERIANIRTVRAFAQEEREKGAYHQEVDNVFRLARKEAFVSAAFFGTANLAGSASMLSVLYYGGHLIIQDAITGGMLTSFLMYTVYVGFSVMKMTSFYSDIMKGLGASQRVFELIDATPTIPNHGGIIPKSVHGDISFEDIAFNYPLRPQAQIFSGLSLHVRQGQVLAVVGPSGSGKSTLAALLLRFYDPQAGHVLLDGTDIRTIDPTWLRQNVAIVSQEPMLFSTSILENIRYANKDATLEQVQAAAREANAHDFIMRFPDGYNTNVGEKGLNLSGGQKQRVAIARALLTNPKVLILDEATSALDAESEHLVQDALDRLMNGRTVIVIAHRLSTVKKADTIAVLDQGHVVELGSHSELMSRPNSTYRHLMKLQHL